MEEYIKRKSLMEGIDEFLHTSCIQSLTRETEEAKTLWKGIHSGVNYCRNHILEAPVEDVAPVIHGRWVEEKWTQTNQHICSLCSSTVRVHPQSVQYKYCPYCGAKMKEKENNK